ncbi:MAG: pyridoxal-phosphate dependent enzyme [Bdellovibrionales bacterium]|nr:pyridoxal-phosphate dependent enzyme [Bdellovibrionales bacterium]
MLNYKNIIEAYKRIEPYIVKTPLLENNFLQNDCGGVKVLFKCEGFQKVGAFKSRGALNFLLANKPALNQQIIAFSSGNHAQAVAWACALLGYKKIKVFMPYNSSLVKINGTKQWGAQIELCESRSVAEDLCYEMQKKGALLIPPYDHEDIICGQGTVVYESQLINGFQPDLIAVPLGGGGLMSGSYLAKPSACDLVAGEPRQANDGVRSIQSGKIFRFQESPQTIADGARTLSLSALTFEYAKKTTAIYDFDEMEILQATQILMHHLKIIVEPTSALAYLAAKKQLQLKKYQRVLVILSGANVDNSTMKTVWEQNLL